MANNKTVPTANDILKFFLVLAEVAPTRPTNLYISLHTADPGNTGAASNEISGGLGYARQLITFAAEASGATTNNNEPTFGPATAGWGTATHFGICKSNVIGTADLIYKAALTTPRIVNTGGTAKFAAGSINAGEL